MSSWYGDLFGFWLAYLGVGLVAALPSLAAYAFYRVFTAWLDRHFSDSLPASAGDWVKERLSDLGLDDKISLNVIHERGGHSPDSYWPSARRILLGATV